MYSGSFSAPVSVVNPSSALLSPAAAGEYRNLGPLSIFFSVNRRPSAPVMPPAPPIASGVSGCRSPRPSTRRPPKPVERIGTDAALVASVLASSLAVVGASIAPACCCAAVASSGVIASFFMGCLLAFFMRSFATIIASPVDAATPGR